MKPLLSLRLTSARFDELAAGVVGIVLMLVCTAVVAFMAPELSLARRILLTASIGAGWFVLGWIACVIAQRRRHFDTPRDSA